MSETTQNKFKVGDIVKFTSDYPKKDNPFLKRFQTIIEVRNTGGEVTTGQLVKTHLINDSWTDACWFSHAKITLWDKIKRFFGKGNVPRQIRVKFDPAKVKFITREEFNKKIKK